MSKRASRHVPKNSIGVIISFKKIEDRNVFVETDDYKMLIGEADVIAKKAGGKLTTFWNP